MPVVSQCPRCRAVLVGTGAPERCLRCGEVVVAVSRKLCARCGLDITDSPRLKDPSGQYHCQACWLEICEASGQEPAYVCADCGGWFAGDQVYQEKNKYTCKACFEGRTGAAAPAGMTNAELKAMEEVESSSPTVSGAAAAFAPSLYRAQVAAHQSQARKKDRRKLAMIVAAGVLLIGLLVAYIVHLYR